MCPIIPCYNSRLTESHSSTMVQVYKVSTSRYQRSLGLWRHPVSKALDTECLQSQDNFWIYYLHQSQSPMGLACIENYHGAYNMLAYCDNCLPDIGHLDLWCISYSLCSQCLLEMLHPSERNKQIWNVSAVWKSTLHEYKQSTENKQGGLSIKKRLNCSYFTLSQNSESHRRDCF